MSYDGLFTLTNWIYLLSLFAAAVTSVGLWRLSTVMGEDKDRQLEQYKAEAADRIAGANLTAEQAKRDAAQANLRAAALEKDAAEARAEQERLRAHSLELELQIKRIGPRQLTTEQQSKISKQAEQEGFKPLVKIDYSDDPEAISYAEAIASTLVKSGFRVEEGVRILSGGYEGITTRDRTGTMQRLLTSAEIKFREQRQQDNEQAAIIEIGKKPVR